MLRSHPLLSLFPTSALSRLADESTLQEYAKGSVLVREGDPCEAIHLLISGRCEAQRAGHSGTAEVERVFGPGDLFGEAELLHEEPYRTTITVLSRSELLRIPCALLREIFADNSTVAGQFSLGVARQRRIQNESRRKFALHTRRIIALFAIARQLNQRAVAKRLAIALRGLAGQQVLLLHLMPGAEKPALAGCVRHDRLDGHELCFAEHVHAHRQGYHELNLYVAGTEQEPPAVAPLLSHFGRHFDFVIVDVYPEVHAPTSVEVLGQSDMAFVWIEPTIQHLLDFKSLLGRVCGEDKAACAEIKPIVSVGDCGVEGEFSAELDQLARPVHSFVRGAPLEGTDGSIDRPGNFALHINRIAREIARCRIGLALSSGASKGLAHIGVIQVLEENGIEIDCVAGSSMGAYVGAVWTSGHNGEQCEKIARELETRWGALHLAHPSFPPRQGFLRTGRVIKRLRESIGAATFSDLVLPLRVVATYLDTLERAVFSTGDVGRAVEASIAIPGICVPVVIDGETFIDGGVADPLPVNVLRGMGIERVIAVNTIPTPERLREALGRVREREAQAANSIAGRIGAFFNRHINYFARGNVADVMLRALHGAQTRVAEQSCAAADVVLRPWTEDSRWYDFTNPRKYIALGREVAQEQLPELKALVAQKPDDDDIPQPRLAPAA
ncbi:MAG: cyclic nucleotide-binding and patatin-like phospholipase domain-containing protein [Chthoniobacteraceae bacterium]